MEESLYIKMVMTTDRIIMVLNLYLIELDKLSLFYFLLI
jgi:hypothetical protein